MARRISGELARADDQAEQIEHLQGRVAEIDGELYRRGVLIRQLQGLVGPGGGGGSFASGSGPPTAAIGQDGAIYLDTATGRFYGPKAAGAWPAAPIGRLMPLNPTYAQLKAG